jgi:uncharacterized protein
MPPRRASVLLLGALAFAFARLPARAFDVPVVPSGRVNDYADVLEANAAAAIEAKLAAFEHESSTQVVVVVVPKLDGQPIEDVARRTFELWGLGQGGRDNGVLLVVSMFDRRARIEVGYGLEHMLTDALSRRILEDALFPAFRKGDRAGGILATCDGIIAATRGAYVGPPPKREASSMSTVLGYIVSAILFVAILGFFVYFVMRFRRNLAMAAELIQKGGGHVNWGGRGGSPRSAGGSGRSRSSGSRSSGGFSGGGGRSGGGGASGSW